MRRLVITIAGAAVLVCGATAASASTGWGTARQVPGMAALNTGGNAEVETVSCASAGNCGAGGFYSDTSQSHRQAFVVSEVNGVWGHATEVHGSGPLNADGNAAVEAVSCASAGNCGAGGFYTDAAGNDQLFVVSEVNGVWGSATQVPGAAALDKGETATFYSVSCRSAGNCSAGGYYTDGSNDAQAFVVSEVNGVWGAAEEVPGTASLNQGEDAVADTLSCGSAGNCSAGGYYTVDGGGEQTFVANETKGVWGTAKEVPGTATLSTRGYAAVTSVACRSAGNCSAGGWYYAANVLPFVVSEVNGVWGIAKEVPGMVALGAHGPSELSTLSCGSVGNCAGGGFYTDAAGHEQAFLVSQANGAWGPAEEAPGTGALNQGGKALVNSVSCWSAGNCSAVGNYRDASGHRQAFVTDETNGTWGTAEEVPGTAALNQGGLDTIPSVSCAPSGSCATGGDYTTATGNQKQAFVVSK